MEEDTIAMLDSLVLIGIVILSIFLVIFSFYAVFEPKISKEVSEKINSGDVEDVNFVLFTSILPCNERTRSIKAIERALSRNITALRPSTETCIIYIITPAQIITRVENHKKITYIRTLEELKTKFQGEENAELGLVIFGNKNFFLLAVSTILLLLFYVWIRLEDIKENFAPVRVVVDTIQAAIPPQLTAWRWYNQGRQDQLKRQKQLQLQVQQQQQEQVSQKQLEIQAAQNQLLNYASALNNFNEDLDFMKKTKTISPKQKKLMLQLAIMNDERKEFDKAVRQYEYVISLSPNHIVAWNNLGFIYHIQKNREKSLQCFRQCISMLRGYTDAKSRAYGAIAHMMLGEVNQAQEYVDETFFKEHEDNLKILLPRREFLILDFIARYDTSGFQSYIRGLH